MVFKNRQGAFNGDIVRVAVYGQDNNKDKHGKVEKVLDFQHSMKYVCKADERNIITFHPIFDKTLPGIVNLPKLSNAILQHKPKEFSELQNQYICVFEESSLDVGGNLSLKIKELIPFEISSSLLFVVKVLNWSPRYRKPLGAVIEALPRTSNMFITEKLLLTAHDIPEYYDVSTDVSDSTEYVPPTPTLNHKTYESALAIDPIDTLNCDDAVNIYSLNEQNMYELVVLIIDVTQYIPIDSKLDQIAKNRGTSVYGGQIKNKEKLSSTMHMLPKEFTTTCLSLNNECIRPVIAISAEVQVNDGNVVEIKENPPSVALLTNTINLSYNEAQSLMNGDGDDLLVTNAKQLKITLQLLFKVAMKIRIDRLGIDAAHSYTVSDSDDEPDWQCHLLVEELMIWANSCVAQYMINKCPPSAALLRCQNPPIASDLTKLSNVYQDFLQFSLCHESLMTTESSSTAGLLIPLHVIKTLQNAYKRKQFKTIARILSQEQNFPQLAMIEAAMMSISRLAKYHCITSPEHVLSHYSIKKHYTHFSSPIRRYFDIIVQRILESSY